MIKTFGLLVFLICALASFNFAQGVDAGVKEVETGKSEKKPTPNPTKTIITKATVKKSAPKPTKPVAAKPTVSKSMPSTKVVSKPKPSSANLGEPKILWTDDCDPRKDSNRCSISTREAVTDRFYDVIKLVNGKITYKIPESKEELESYQVVIVHFCSDNINENLINVIKMRISS